MPADDPAGRAGDEALLLSEARLSRSQAMAHVGDWEWDLATNRVHWSDEVYRIYGYGPREIDPDYGLVLQAMHSESRDQYLAAIDAALKGERPFEMDYVFLTRGGIRKTIHTIGEVLRDERGQPVKMVGTVQDITARTRVEAALRESEGRFRALFEGAPDAAVLADIETGKILDVNSAACRLLGREREQAIGLHQTAIHPPRFLQQYREAFQERIRQSLASGSFRPFEGFVLRADGEEVAVQILSRQIVLRGRPVMYGVFRDVSDRQRTEAALRRTQEGLLRSQDLLTSAEKIAGLGSWEWEIEPNRLAWSEGVFRIYGLDPARTVPSYETVVEMVHPAYRAAFLEAIAATLTRGQPFDGQYCLVRPDGSVRFTHTKAEVVRDAKGRPVKMVGIVQDISERKRSETFIQDILETVDEGFLIIDRDYTVLSANRAYAGQAGLSLAEIVGKKCYAVSHGLTRPCHEAGEDCAVRRVFEKGEPAAALHTHQDAAGNAIYVETKAFPMTDPTGQISAAIEIVNNITERKRLEEQYRQAQKMEAVALLAGGVAHDFNNLLTAISGYGHLLSVKLGQGDPLRGHVEQILGAADRAASLTQSLMAFGRKQIVNPVPVDLNGVVGQLLKLLQRVIGEDIDLVTELAPDNCTVFADPSQIEQVLMNLATNARDAMPQGGALTIRTERYVIDEKFRKDHGFGEDGVWACLRVSDTGTGMDEKTRSRIFEPFFTTKELGRGTGLGLASVYGIVKQSQGYITVESEPGAGTSFSMLLPLVEQPELRAERAHVPAAGTGSETILLVEDDPVLRELLRRVLNSHGYEVIEAANGEEAVTRFSESGDRVHLLILDMIMPRKNGKEAYTAIARLRPGIKALFISGYSSTILDPGLLDGPGCHFIAKPVAPPALLGKVRDILDGVGA